MSDLILMLYHYALDRRFSGYLEQREYRKVNAIEDQNLNDLKATLNEKQLDILDRFQDTANERQKLELEAMFQAAFAIARELF